MSRNQIRIISDKKKGTLKFQIINEKEEWNAVSNDSPLSREKYTHSNIETHAKDIIEEINSEYNLGNRGVDIFFIGEKREYDFLKKAINDCCLQGTIKCAMKRSRIAVAGKTGTGKSILIKRLLDSKGKNIYYRKIDGVQLYTDDNETTTWYEIPGIDFGTESLNKTRECLEKLIKSGIMALIYCLGTSKIEKTEEKFILFVRDKHPDIKILVVLTRSVNSKDDLYAEQISRKLNGIKVIPVLAMDMETRAGVVHAYGLDDIDRYIFEDK